MISWKAKRTSSLKRTKKIVKLKNAYALEVEKNENLSKKLSTCHDSISCLGIENDNLVSKIEELNACNDLISCLRDENARLKSKIEELNACKPSTSTIDHVTMCTRCRDINIEAIDDHLAMIKQQNDHIAKLDAKIAEHELENEKFKFARSMFYNGRRPSIKDGIGFQQGNQNNTKFNASKKLSNFVKGKAPMVQDSEGTFYILQAIPNIKLRRFMLGNLILFLTMHLCTKMRLLALGIPLMLKYLERKFLMHQMNIMFHLRLLMLHMF
jgi:hypothetical protein